MHCNSNAENIAMNTKPLTKGKEKISEKKNAKWDRNERWVEWRRGRSWWWYKYVKRTEREIKSHFNLFFLQ